jgi:hypothetical protein
VEFVGKVPKPTPQLFQVGNLAAIGVLAGDHKHYCGNDDQEHADNEADALLKLR